MLLHVPTARLLAHIDSVVTEKDLERIVRRASGQEGAAASFPFDCKELGAEMGTVVVHLGGLYLVCTCSCYYCKPVEPGGRLEDTAVGVHQLRIALVLGPELEQPSELGRCELGLGQPGLFACLKLQPAVAAEYQEPGSG
jgi:hypothetical protein